MMGDNYRRRCGASGRTDWASSARKMKDAGNGRVMCPWCGKPVKLNRRFHGVDYVMIPNHNKPEE